MGARLVRDRIGELEHWSIPEAKAGLRPVADREEHRRLLVQKLLEEVGEFIVTETYQNAIEEAADVLEVLCSFLEVYHGNGNPLRRVIDRLQAKYAERGGFEIGTAWEAMST